MNIQYTLIQIKKYGEETMRGGGNKSRIIYKERKMSISAHTRFKQVSVDEVINFLTINLDIHCQHFNSIFIYFLKK